MMFRNLEVNYLIALIASTINKRTTPAPLSTLDWRELFYLAEYHGVTNISYYSLLGIFDTVPEPWKTRFSIIFRKWVSIYTTQEKEIEMVLEELELEKIDYMLSKEWLMKRYYPQLEMRVVENIEIFIKAKQEMKVRELMRDLGYNCKEMEERSSVAFYRDSKFKIVFRHKMFEDNPKLSAYYQKPWKKLKLAVGYGCRYAFTPEEHYIYMVSSVCDDYARGKASARQVIDIFLYLKKHSETLDRTYIDQEFTKLGFEKLCKCLEDVGQMWLGVYEGGETGESRDVEEYIWSKGAFGKETSIKLLPMIVDMELWVVRETRKRKILKVIWWFFPRMSHMQNRFPSIEKRKVLLPLYWVLRWLMLIWFYIKVRAERIIQIVSRKLYEITAKKSLMDEVPKDDEP